MAAKKTYPYAIHYNDGSYMVYDLTREDFDKIKKHMAGPPNVRIIECSIGILNLQDVRSVIEQRVPKKPKPILAAHPNLTAEDIEWLALNKEAWSLGNEDEGGIEQ